MEDDEEGRREERRTTSPYGTAENPLEPVSQISLGVLSGQLEGLRRARSE